MKKLDLSSYGVQEMNAKELKNVDGGINPLRWLAEYGLAKFADYIFSGAYGRDCLKYDVSFFQE